MGVAEVISDITSMKILWNAITCIAVGGTVVGI
jgi:hypothetical protein